MKKLISPKKPSSSQGLNLIPLPKPTNGRSKSVISALHERRTDRTIGDKKLSLQMLSNLLWSSCGINRNVGPFGVPGSTAASASNSQEIQVYVAMVQGCYLYHPDKHILDKVINEDVRALAIGKGQGSLGSPAPVRLIYVANIDKFQSAGFQEPGLKDPETQKAYYYVDTGLIAGNVYLFCSSQELSAWFHNCQKEELATKLKLGKQQRVLFAQTVGYPA